jgi:hypothetical protein
MADDPQTPDEIDWSLTTFEGSRREQLRRWRALSFEEMLAALEEMEEFARMMGAKRRSS